MNEDSRRVLASFACLALAACGDAPSGLSTSTPTRGGDVASAELPGGASSGDAPSAPGPAIPRDGVVFIHGTSDFDPGAYACRGAGADFRCVAQKAVDEYWQQGTLDSERTRADGSKRPFAVVGCPLASETPWPNPSPVRRAANKPEPGTGACAGAQIAKFLDGPDGKPGTADDIRDIVIVTHSGGSNVARYILQQRSAKPEYARVHEASRGFIGIAAPNHGTYLADWMFTFGSLGSIASSLTRLVGGDGFFDDDGVAFIRTTSMSLFNRDPAKLVDLSKDVAGVPSFMASGTFPDAAGDAAKVACGGNAETQGLRLLHALYMGWEDAATFRDDCSDGFISCRSAMALANGDPARVLFGRLDDGRVIGRTRFRAHNQSRLQCDGLDIDVRKKVQELLDRGGAGTPPSVAAGDSPAEVWSPSPASLRVIRHGFTRRAPSGAPALDARDGATGVRLEVEAPSSVRAGGAASVAITVVGAEAGDVDALSGYVESPARDVRVPLAFERTEGGALSAYAKLPAGATSATWTAHVDARGHDKGGVPFSRDADVPIAVTRVVTRLASARAKRVATGVEITVELDATEAGRVGIRAALVREAAGSASVVAREQVGLDVAPGQRTFTWVIPVTDLAGVHLRDLAIVRHDDASTQAVVDEVPIAR